MRDRKISIFVELILTASYSSGTYTDGVTVAQTAPTRLVRVQIFVGMPEKFVAWCSSQYAWVKNILPF